MRGEQRLKRNSQQDGWMGVSGERRGIHAGQRDVSEA